MAEESKNSLTGEDRVVPVITPPGDNLCSCESRILDPSVEKTLLNTPQPEHRFAYGEQEETGHQLDLGTVGLAEGNCGSCKGYKLRSSQRAAKPSQYFADINLCPLNGQVKERHGKSEKTHPCSAGPGRDASPRVNEL